MSGWVHMWSYWYTCVYKGNGFWEWEQSVSRVGGGGGEGRAFFPFSLIRPCFSFTDNLDSRTAQRQTTMVMHCIITTECLKKFYIKIVGKYFAWCWKSLHLLPKIKKIALFSYSAVMKTVSADCSIASVYVRWHVTSVRLALFPRKSKLLHWSIFFVILNTFACVPYFPT